MPRQQAAVRRNGQRTAADVVRREALADERGVRGPQLVRVCAVCPPHIRSIAAVGKVVERVAVGRKRAVAFVRARGAMYADGQALAVLEFHRPHVAACREGDLPAVGSERAVPGAVAVVEVRIAAAHDTRRGGVEECGLERDAPCLRSLGLRIDAPEVESLREHQRAPVARERGTEHVVVREMRDLPLFARRKGTAVEVAHAVRVAEIVEARAVGRPDGRRAVVAALDDRRERAHLAVEHPDVAGVGRLRPCVAFAELKPALLDLGRKEDLSSVGRERRTERRRIEEQLFRLARAHGDENRTARKALVRRRFGGVVAVREREHLGTVRRITPREKAFGVECDLSQVPRGHRSDVEVHFEQLQRSPAVGEERDALSVGRKGRPGIRRHSVPNRHGRAAGSRGEPHPVLPLEREVRTVRRHGRVYAEVHLRPVTSTARSRTGLRKC